MCDFGLVFTISILIIVICGLMSWVGFLETKLEAASEQLEFLSFKANVNTDSIVKIEAKLKALKNTKYKKKVGKV